MEQKLVTLRGVGPNVARFSRYLLVYVDDCSQPRAEVVSYSAVVHALACRHELGEPRIFRLDERGNPVLVYDADSPTNPHPAFGGILNADAEQDFRRWLDSEFCDDDKGNVEAAVRLCLDHDPSAAPNGFPGLSWEKLMNRGFDLLDLDDESSHA